MLSLGVTLLLMLLVGGVAHADPTPVPLPSLVGLALEDQHGERHTIPTDTRTVIFASDMDASKVVHALLEQRDPDWLPRHHAVFIADIHRMPGIITRLFALPKMRRHKYRMLLIRDETTGARFPRKPDELTVLTLDQLRPIAVTYLSSVEALERAVVAGVAIDPTPAASPGTQ